MSKMLKLRPTKYATCPNCWGHGKVAVEWRTVPADQPVGDDIAHETSFYLNEKQDENKTM